MGAWPNFFESGRALLADVLRGNARGVGYTLLAASAASFVMGLWVPLMHASSAPRDVGLVVALVASSLVPGLMLAATWPRRWYVLADESLRPTSRRQFILEQGAAMALEHVSTWAWVTALPFTTAVLFTSTSAHRVFPQLMLALPILAGAQVLIFGVIVWILRYRSGWLVVTPVLLVAVIGVAVLVAGGHLAEKGHVAPALQLGGVLAAAGVAIALHAPTAAGSLQNSTEILVTFSPGQR